jgi:Plasmid pRiA4b ORF-3-like protein
MFFGPSVYVLRVSLRDAKPEVWPRLAVRSDANHVINERSATVRHVLPRVGPALKWDYDFGDSWQHDVVVEAIDEPKETTRYPICVDGACACRPEDCGGTTGYGNRSLTFGAYLTQRWLPRRSSSHPRRSPAISGSSNGTSFQRAAG